MKIALLAIAILATSLVVHHGIFAQEDIIEDVVSEEEPEQTEADEMGDEVDDAVQDEPINEPDQSDDVASSDEPHDESQDFLDYSEELTDEPQGEIDDSQEPVVKEEQEGEGEQVEESLDEGITLDFIDEVRERRDSSYLFKRLYSVRRAPKPAKNPAQAPKPTTKQPPAHPSPNVKWDDKIRCTGAQDRGPCQQNIKRWHYNPDSNKCEEFKYSGCGGNDNNWVELQNCIKVCVKTTPKPSPTTLPPAYPLPGARGDDKTRCAGHEVRGPCKQNIKRWHYNENTNKCDEFQYSGCGGNNNNWIVRENCVKTCVKVDPPKPQPKPAKKPPAHPSPNVKWNDKIRCTGPQLRGPCKQNIKRFHYNPVTNTCNQFQYSGCGGNDNNWVYLGNCQKVCVKKSPPKKPAKPQLKWNDPLRCQGPIVKGNCKQSIRRFHYNAATDRCEAFTWTGCQDTPNNWWYVKNCQKVCVKNKPPPKTNWNDPKRCVGPEERGPCNKNIRRYHYNAQTDKCEPFSFGGCGGNVNNWGYLKNCQKICVKNKPQPPAKVKWDDTRRCEGPLVKGPCNKKIRRYHYNAVRDQCEAFEYSGCEGNHNNWWYRGNCLKICKKKKLPWNDPDRCKGPEVRGPCNKNIRRYHYNSELDKCEPFSYGGCAGNDNNWWYKGNCDRICVKNHQPVNPKPPKWNDPVKCMGPVDVGNCQKSVLRYHYNSATDKCEPFQYSGCGGNNNNWWYQGNCRKVCVKHDDEDSHDKDSHGGKHSHGKDSHDKDSHGGKHSHGKDSHDKDSHGGKHSHGTDSQDKDSHGGKHSHGDSHDHDSHDKSGEKPPSDGDLEPPPSGGDEVTPPSGDETDGGNGGDSGLIFLPGPAQCQQPDGGVGEKVTTPCPLVSCWLRCQFGFEADSRGCPTCACSEPSCRQESALNKILDSMS